VSGQSAKLRLGVDVGGTFTKAVAIQTQPYALISEALVPTTHDAPEGVALGIVQVLRDLLANVSADRVSLVAHSTTQAVNALLEGDTAFVGIVGMGRGRDASDSARFTRVGDIPLAPGKFLHTSHVFLDTTQGLTKEVAAHAVDSLAAQGVQALVASEAFSVDDPANENLILDLATARGIPAVGGYQLSGVYGLEIRTLTAAINASLLPKMLQTAELVERSLQVAGIGAPLMVMRGDGGLTDLTTLRRRPILTLLSGPAASLVGALLSGGVANGVFIEIGGTSSNLGVVRGGQPELAYVRVMDHPTCVRSLDVRVQGIAGGSMVRLKGRKPIDVGPRSAHIGGLEYASLSQEIETEPALELALIAPKPGDPADYAIVRGASGKQWAITVTCAANALGLVPAGAHALGSQTAALKAFEPLGRLLGCSAEEAAGRMLDLAARNIADAVEALAAEYRLRKRNYQLIGGGGGAGALVPAIAQRLGVSYRLVEHAEVISSLGDALASIREELERAIGDGVSPDMLSRQAEEAAIKAGADPDSVQVVIERDEDRGTLRAVAVGHVALAAPVATAEVTESEARTLASEAGHVPDLRLLADTGGFWVYQSPGGFLRRIHTLVMDRRGTLRVEVYGGRIFSGLPEQVRVSLEKELAGAEDAFGALPSIRLLIGAKLLDLANVSGSEKPLEVANAALDHAEPGKTVVAIIER
jgi:N-methylhydantoinase A